MKSDVFHVFATCILICLRKIYCEITLNDLKSPAIIIIIIIIM